MKKIYLLFLFFSVIICRGQLRFQKMNGFQMNSFHRNENFYSYQSSKESIKKKLDSLKTISNVKKDLSKGDNLKKLIDDSSKKYIGSTKNRKVKLLGSRKDSVIQWMGIVKDEQDLTEFKHQNQIDITIEAFSTSNSSPPSPNIQNIINKFKAHLGKNNRIITAQSSIFKPEILNIKKNNRDFNFISKDIITLMPTIYSLDSFVSYIGNQNGIYACSAWAAAGIKSIDDNIKNGKKYGESNRTNMANFYSPSFIFTKAKESIGNSPCTEGIDLIDALSVLKEYGTPSLDHCLYFTNNFNCQVDIQKFMDEAKRNRITKFPPIDLQIIDFKYVLSHNCAIALEINIDDNFIYQGYLPVWTKQNPFIWKNFLGISKRGTLHPHSVICVGYNDNIGAFLMVNSFGISFGNNGFFWIDYNFMFKQEVIKQAYRLETKVYDSSVFRDNFKINKLNTFKSLNNDNQVLTIAEGKGKISAFRLQWEVPSIINLNLVHLKIYNEEGNIIRKDISVSSGICNYFSYKHFNYYIQLQDIKESTTTIGGLINIPAKAQLSISRLNNSFEE